MSIPSNVEELIDFISENLPDNESGLIEEPTMRETLEKTVRVLDLKFSLLAPNLTSEQYALWQKLSYFKISELKGIATPANSPTAWSSGDPDLYEKYDVFESGTFTNYKDSNNSAIVVSPADLVGNKVYITVYNGVAKKILISMPSNLDEWTSQSYSEGKTVTKDNKIFRVKPGQTASSSDVPGISDVWEMIGSSGVDGILKHFIEQQTSENITRLLTNENSQLLGIEVNTSGYLVNSNSVFPFSESGNTFKNFLNIPLQIDNQRRIKSVDLKIIRYGATTAANLIGIRENGSHEILVGGVSNPGNDLENIHVDLTEFEYISISGYYTSAKPNSLNTEWKFNIEVDLVDSVYNEIITRSTNATDIKSRTVLSDFINRNQYNGIVNTDLRGAIDGYLKNDGTTVTDNGHWNNAKTNILTDGKKYIYLKLIRVGTTLGTLATLLGRKSDGSYVHLIGTSNVGNKVIEEFKIDVSQYTSVSIAWNIDQGYAPYIFFYDSLVSGIPKNNSVKQHIEGKFGSNYVVMAAANSTDAEKEGADIVCLGSNDEISFRRAMNLLIERSEDHSCVGIIKLCGGDYNIDGLYNDDGGEKYGISVPFTTNGISMVKIVGATTSMGQHLEKTRAVSAINLTNSVVESTQFSLIRTQFSVDINWRNVLGLENVLITIPDKLGYKCIAVNGMYANDLALKNVTISSMNFINQGSNPNNVNTGYEVGSIAVRGTQGSNYGIYSKWETVFVSGFHKAFEVSGEHLVLELCTARTNYYGFTFFTYPCNIGNWTHPITMINCADERSQCMPLFGSFGNKNNETTGGGRQPIYMNNLTMEWLPSNDIGGLELAKILNPEAVFVKLDYSIQSDYSSTNSKTQKFWSDLNSAKYADSFNNAHRKVGSTTERLSYSTGANLGQQFFDQTLNKMVIYNGIIWTDFNGNAV